MASNHVVIAGASGYLGRHLIESTSQHSDTKVTGLLRPTSAKSSRVVADNVTYSVLDVTDETATRSLLSRMAPTHVINASSYGVNPSETGFTQSVSVNTWGTYALLAGSAQAGVKRFTQVGSYFEYAPFDGEISEDAPLDPSSVYAATKAAASLLINDRRIRGDMEALTTRVFHIWGAEEPAHRLTSQVRTACLKRRPLDLTAGTQQKDFTYVCDAARWIADLTLHAEPLPYSAYNIAGGTRCTVRDFVTSLATELDGIDLLRFGKRAMPQREPPSGLANTARLASLLGPLTMTPFEIAMKQTLCATEAP